MILEPMRVEQYYEVHLDLIFPFLLLNLFDWSYYLFYLILFLLIQIREPFNVMSVVKSPMGLMMGFMLVVMFLMPKLMENMGKVLWSILFMFHLWY